MNKVIDKKVGSNHGEKLSKPIFCNVMYDQAFIKQTHLDNWPNSPSMWKVRGPNHAT